MVSEWISYYYNILKGDIYKWPNDKQLDTQSSVEGLDGHSTSKLKKSTKIVQKLVDVVNTVSNVKIERGISIDLDREAKRVIKKMPKWVPGESAGRAVRARCRLPINFQLQ